MYAKTEYSKPELLLLELIGKYIESLLTRKKQISAIEMRLLVHIETCIKKYRSRSKSKEQEQKIIKS